MENPSPWITGVIDGLTATRLILNTNIEGRNRLALILLDSTLEVSFKYYLTYVKRIRGLPDSTLRYREELHKIVKKHTNFSTDVWDAIDYFYERRSELYHEDAGKTLPDKSIFDFFELVIAIIDQLFSINSQALIKNPNDVLIKISRKKININKTRSKIEAVVVAIGSVNAVPSSSEVKEILDKMGYKTRVLPAQISSLIKNKSYKHYFYYDKKSKMWTLSDTGQDKYNGMLIEYGE